MSRYFNPVTRYTDDSGEPLLTGKLYFYETGTSTLTDTYKNADQTILNANPVELTGAGEVPNIFFSGTLKVVLRDDAGQYWEKDPVTSGTGGSLVTDWDALITYDASDIVRFELIYYTSKINNNINNDPSELGVYWETWPSGDITCDTVTVGSVTADTVTADEFVGNLTGQIDASEIAVTTDSPTHVIIDSGSSDIEKQVVDVFKDNIGLGHDIDDDYDASATVILNTAKTITDVGVVSVETGDIILVSGGVNYTLASDAYIGTALYAGSGTTASYKISGYASGQVGSHISAKASSFVNFANVGAIVEITAPGDISFRLEAYYTSGPATLTAADASLARVFILKQ